MDGILFDRVFLDIGQISIGFCRGGEDGKGWESFSDFQNSLDRGSGIGDNKLPVAFLEYLCRLNDDAQPHAADVGEIRHIQGDGVDLIFCQIIDEIFQFGIGFRIQFAGQGNDKVSDAAFLSADVKTHIVLVSVWVLNGDR